MTVGDPQRAALRIIQAFLAVVLVVALFLALVVPYHATDGLVYGAFSKELSLHGGFLLDQVGYGSYARPLFYVPQGWLWWAFGAHDWIGRLLSLAFFALLLWSVFRLTADRTLPRVAPWLAVLALFASPDVVVQAFAGQTDVPVAALLGAAAVVLWRRPGSWGAFALIAVMAAAAVLGKSTALPALVGLGLAHLIGSRQELAGRVRWGIAPLALGAVVGLLYDFALARHFGVSIDVFLGGAYTDPGQSSLTGAVSALPDGVAAATPSGAITERVRIAFDAFFASDRHASALVQFAWLGPYLRLVLLFSLLYAVARAVGVAHRRSALAAIGVTVIVFVIGPLVLPGAGSIGGGGAIALLGTVALALVLASSAWVPQEWVVSRELVARLLVWSIPSIAAWVLFGILEDTRTMSPAWPAVFPLIGATTAMGVAAIAARRAWLGAGAAVVLLVLAVANFRNFDGLGVQPDGSYSAWSALRKLTPGTWTDPAAARRAADPQLGGLVDGALARAPGTAVRTNDGRLIFFDPERTTVEPALPADCAELKGTGAVAVITAGYPAADLQRLAALPCLEPIGGAPGSWATYRVTS